MGVNPDHGKRLQDGPMYHCLKREFARPKKQDVKCLNLNWELMPALHLFCNVPNSRPIIVCGDLRTNPIHNLLDGTFKIIDSMNDIMEHYKVWSRKM